MTYVTCIFPLMFPKLKCHLEMGNEGIEAVSMDMGQEDRCRADFKHRQAHTTLTEGRISHSLRRPERTRQVKAFQEYYFPLWLWDLLEKSAKKASFLFGDGAFSLHGSIRPERSYQLFLHEPHLRGMRCLRFGYVQTYRALEPFRSLKAQSDWI